MYLFWNNQISEMHELSLAYNDRGYQYGDGLFETMIMNSGRINLFSLHWERLKEGMSFLAMEPPLWLKDATYMEKILLQLAKKNGFENHARIRLQVTRKPGGLFTPIDNGVNVLGAVKELQEPHPLLKPAVQAGISEKYWLHPSPISKFKTCSALPYVMAGMEKAARNLDDIILLDQQGHIAECLVSNLFWIKKGQWHTPSLDTGCVEGVMRKNIINFIAQEGTELKEVKVKPEEILGADFIFNCNAGGITPLKKIDGTIFESVPKDKILYLIEGALKSQIKQI